MKSVKSPSNKGRSTQNLFSTEHLKSRVAELEETGERKALLAFYLKVIESYSSPPAWVYSKAIALSIKLKSWQIGLQIGEKALIAYSKSAEVHQALDKLYQQPVDSSNYIDHYLQLLVFEPQQPDWLYLNLTQQLLQQDRKTEAIETAERGIKLYPSYYPLRYLLGVALSLLKQTDRAVACFQQVKQIDPNWLEIEQKLERSLSSQERVRESSSSSTASAVSEPLESRSQPKLTDISNIFARLKAEQSSTSDCQLIWQDYEGQELSLDYGCWLSPSILYLEATVNDSFNYPESEILVCSASRYAIARIRFELIPEQKLVAIACFDSQVYTAARESYRLCINRGGTPVFITGEVWQKAYGLELIEYLKTKTDFQKHRFREAISTYLIELIPENNRWEARDILKKLQYFLEIPVSNYVNPNLPFKIFIDYLIPLKTEGLFISGWLQDAYEMLEKITIVSALGFSLELSTKDIYRVERSDVDRFLQNTRYGDFGGDLGFCAYAAVPEEIRRSLQGLAELHSFRFVIHLQGEIVIEIVPDAQYSDFYNARQKVMQITSPDRISPQMLANCIAPTGLKLQQFCMDEVKIKDVIKFGTPVENPRVSLIIPLYRRLDFLKVQLATMANDPAVKQCEIIYVLDSPEQEAELTSLLSHRCTLYQLSVKLVVMQHNSGYAAANNAGASQATGKYLILLNSDVFAKTKGWMAQMADFYASQSQIGALGAKLLYEDGSLQHAGMFFARTTFPFWLNLHYYKGLPGNYPLAQTTRKVPAVTGACLMISKELYDRVGGLTTDYIIGDFEDSDLCFKCRQLGYDSWYLAEVSLYHLERQSVPLNSSYNGSLAWLLNGRLHQERWGKDIEQVMDLAVGS